MPRPLSVLALTRFPPLGASSRLRFFSYQHRLAALGIDVVYQPFFDTPYTRAAFTGERKPLLSALVGLKRRVSVVSATAADLLWIEYEALPWLPYVAERWLLSGRPYVVEYDDALFHRYDLNSRALVKAVLGTKIDRLMAGAASVICGSHYLRDRAIQAGATSVHLLPTVVDVARYGRHRASPDSRTIGWMGSASTERYLDTVAAALKEALSLTAGKLLLVGSGRVPDSLKSLGEQVEARRWRENTEAAWLSEMALGIMPLEDGPWERGKCGYKLVQYMAAGLPAIASPVGENRHILGPPRSTGILASTHDEWVTALVALLKNPQVRQRMGNQARALAEQQYSLDVTAPLLANVLRSAARE